MDSTRLDKWLFHARFYRTRSLAQAAIAGGKVRVNGTRVARPGHVLRCGDVVTLSRGAQILAVRVLALAERRGSASQTCTLYELLED